MKIIIILAIAIIVVLIIVLIVWLYNELNSFGRCNICGGTIKHTDDQNGYRHFICQGCGNEIVIKLPNK
jgi:predicted RNA-binding Zn-ribbon protein involved in translation (DUF1610 family)